MNGVLEGLHCGVVSCHRGSLSLVPSQVRTDTNFVELLEANPWLKSTKLVVKPDMLFGKRGKHDLVGLNLDFNDVEAFIKARMNKVIDMDGCIGAINTFIVEPFVPHDQEYYLCIQVNNHFPPLFTYSRHVPSAA
jgi:ATP citrate (pro-S)-lyase